MNAILPRPSPLAALPAALTAPLKLAADFAKASKAPATQAAYGSDFRLFEDWCAARGLSALPATAAALCGFLADEAAVGKRASTLGRRLAAIRYFHRAAGYDTPTADEKVKAVLSGIRRTIGAAPVRKRAATSDMVIAMSATGTSLRALRDRAIILLGFAGAFRRSELVALDVEDLEEAPEGLLVAIRRSKTDQEGIGRKIAIPRGEIACPVAALRAWLEAAGITEGAVFRRVFNKRAQRVTDKRLAARNVATIVKTAAAKLGLEAAAFAGHSLRAGFVTSAVKRGANLIKITDVTGHRSLEMLKTYSRDAEAFVGHAGAGLYRRTEKNFSKATASTMPRGHRYSAWRSIFSRARFPTEHRGLKDDVQRMTVPTTPSTPRGGLSGFSLVAPHAPECPGAFVVCGRLQPQI